MARNTWSVFLEGPSRTLVTSHAEVTLRGAWLGMLLEIIAAPLFRKVFPNPFSKFRHWVESGVVPIEKASRLPVPALKC